MRLSFLVNLLMENTFLLLYLQDNIIFYLAKIILKLNFLDMKNLEFLQIYFYTYFTLINRT